MKNRNQIKDIYSNVGKYVAEYQFLNENIYSKELFSAYHPVEITSGYDALFIYSDIVYPSLIGDTCAPIMRVVNIPRKYKFGENIHINYDNVHYRPIMINNFETIEISI